MSKHRLGRTDNPTTGRGEGAPEGLQRIEVITGVGRRRRWSPEAKARIVLESRQPGAVVSEVARRHGLSPQQLFGWRRDARGDLADGGDDAPRPTATPFVPIVVTTAADHPDDVAGIAAGGGQIEIAIAGVVIRLRGEFDARMLRAVLQAVRATS